MPNPRTLWPGFTLALRVFLAGCGLTLLAVVLTRETARLAADRQLMLHAAEVELRLAARLAAYEALLRGAAGFFATEGWMPHDRYVRYFGHLKVTDRYPGVQGVGISLRVRPEDVGKLETAARRDGWPDFRVWPPNARPEYHTILYLDPLDERNLAAIGFDMHTEEIRQAAMDRARDTGEPTASGRVTLVQEIRGVRQSGFLIYVPFYEGGRQPADLAGRRERLKGFAYAAFRDGDFLNAVIQPNAHPDFSVEVYDGAGILPEARIYPLFAKEPARGAKRVSTIKALEHPWTLVYTLHASPSVQPWAVAAVGLLVSTGLLLALRRYERAERRAERSEATTRAREGQLSLLVDAVPALVAYFDRSGIVRFSNRRFDEYFGREGQAPVGRRMDELVDPVSRAEVENYAARALQGEGVTYERWSAMPKLGARYMHTLYVPHRGDDGEVVGVYALTSDLTTHKRSEEAARFVADCGKLLIASMDYESTARGIVQLAVPRLADVAVLFRANGGDLVAQAVAHVDDATTERLSRFLDGVRLPIGGSNNLAQAARTGLVVVADELTPEDWERATGDEAQRRMLRALEVQSALHVPVVVHGKIWAVFSFGTTGASRRRFSDEHRHLADEVSTRVRLSVENALLFQAARQEVEERRRAERVARETEERFSLLVEGVQDYAIVALDAIGRIESWNGGAERILGFPEAHAVGRYVTEFYAPQDRAAAEQQLAAARERGAASDERWFTRQDGTQLWASSHTAVLRDEGVVRGYAWILRDLTDRKRMEEELERRVQLRTVELNEAIQELEAFSYSVSHDLRAPLRSIRGFTELTLEEGGDRLTEEQRGYLDRVRRASTRLERLISDLLTYTRISKTKVELVPVNLDALVGDIVREHPEFQPPRATVRLQSPLATVLGNEAYLTQCITNLVGNAVKFVPEGRTPEVRIWTERRTGWIRLFVADNGIGIAPDRVARAFEMFERLHTTGSYEGTGVGLAIVRRAVQRMNGHVGLESKVGEGTTFWIDLQAV